MITWYTRDEGPVELAAPLSKGEYTYDGAQPKNIKILQVGNFSYTVIPEVGLMKFKVRSQHSHDDAVTCLTATLPTTVTFPLSKPYFSPFHLVVVSDDDATSSFIYYVMCLEARFYDYLASSDVKIK
jgi:hypothetical protein